MFLHLAKSHILQRLTSKANVVLGGRPAGAKYLRFGGVALGPTSGIRVPHEGGGASEGGNQSNGRQQDPDRRSRCRGGGGTPPPRQVPKFQKRTPK